jgi:hypothetical protein
MASWLYLSLLFSRSTSCCVVLTLVVLVAAVTAMAGLGYCIAVEQRALRGRLDILSVNLQLLKTQVNGLHELQQLKTFEAVSRAARRHSASRGSLKPQLHFFVVFLFLPYTNCLSKSIQVDRHAGVVRGVLVQ